jgi:hypothetical protein
MKIEEPRPQSDTLRGSYQRFQQDLRGNHCNANNAGGPRKCGIQR